MVGIYCIQNNLNKKVYIGQSWNIKERFSEHKRLLNLNSHGNRHLQASWNKYGSTNFVFSVICDLSWIENLEKSHAQKILDSAEILWLNYFGGENSNLTYNIKSGGMGGTYSEEYKKWLSDNRKGKFAGKSNSMYGKHHTQATKDKISKSRKGKCAGVNNPRYGKTISEEIRRKISLAHKNRIQSDDEIKKRKLTMQKLRQDPEFQAKLNKGLKEAAKKRRKYSNEFVIMLRQRHSKGDSIKSLSKEFNIPFESCRIMINKIGRFKDI